MVEKKGKSNKSNSLRTEVFAMRLDPKLKYLAEIAARKQRRSLANFIEWAIERTLDGVLLAGSDGPTVSEASTRLWALDEPNRFVLLARHFPDLLTYDEQLFWQIINEYSFYDKDVKSLCQFTYDDYEGHRAINSELVRKCWPEIKAYALGTGTK